MSSILKVNELQDAGGNTILSSDGAGTFTTNFTAGKILQVVQTSDATALSSSSTSFIDTGLSGSITPSSTSSKILVFAAHGTIGADNSGSYGATIKLLRDSTDLIEATALFAHTASTYIYGAGPTLVYLDSPSSTSALAYKTQFRSPQGINFLVDYSEATLTLMEIAG